MNDNTRYEMMKRLAKERPNPQTELRFTTPFELLCAVVLSAQSTDKGVNAVTAKLFLVANTPEQFLKLGFDGLCEYTRSLNYYNNKTRNLLGLSEALIKNFDGKVPQTREELESLPGVGRKTANVVLNVAFGKPTLAVDTHIFRVANRTGFAKGRTPLEVEEGLLKHMPKEFLQNAHHWLLLHGRYCCKALKPLCEECVISDLCDTHKRKMSALKKKTAALQNKSV